MLIPSVGGGTITLGLYALRKDPDRGVALWFSRGANRHSLRVNTE